MNEIIKVVVTDMVTGEVVMERTGPVLRVSKSRPPADVPSYGPYRRCVPGPEETLTIVFDNSSAYEKARAEAETEEAEKIGA